MKKKPSLQPIPPLSFEALTEVQDFEEYARQSLHGCGTSDAYNGEKALRILRTCVVESLDVQIAFYSSLPNYRPEWIKEIAERTMSATISLVGRSGAEYWDYFWDEVRSTVKDHLRAKARVAKNAPKSKTFTQPAKTVPTVTKEAPVNNRDRIEKFILEDGRIGNENHAQKYLGRGRIQGPNRIRAISARFRPQPNCKRQL